MLIHTLRKIFTLYMHVHICVHGHENTIKFAYLVCSFKQSRRDTYCFVAVLIAEVTGTLHIVLIYINSNSFYSMITFCLDHGHVFRISLYCCLNF